MSAVECEENKSLIHPGVAMFAFADISPCCPFYERIKIFAFDLVYFIARECKTNWVPRNRIVDPLSQMTSDIEDGARAIFRNRDGIFLEKYERLVLPGVSAHVGNFYEHAVVVFRYVFNTWGDKIIPNMRHIIFFKTMVYVARLGIMFYEQGVSEAPDHAVLLISECLWCYMHIAGTGVFPILQEIGRDLARQP